MMPYMYMYVYIYREREIDLFMVVYVALQVSYPKTPKALTQSVAHPWCEGAMAIVARFGMQSEGRGGFLSGPWGSSNGSFSR